MNEFEIFTRLLPTQKLYYTYYQTIYIKREPAYITKQLKIL